MGQEWIGAGESSGGDDEAADPLVCAAADGDSDALTVLLALHEPALLGFLRRRWPIDYHIYAEPEDLLQSTYVNAFESVTTLRTRTTAGFRAWLMQLGLNRVRNTVREMRAAKRAHTRAQLGIGADDPTADGLLELLCRSSKSPRSAAGNREFAGLVRDALASMQEDQRRVLHLRFIEQKDFAEIAKITGKGNGAARMTATRALKFLRGLLPLNSSVPRSRSDTPARTVSRKRGEPSG